MSKYKAKRIECDGYKFDSKAEHERYLYLKSLEHIVGLEVHPKYELQPKYEFWGEKIRAITYEADFVYYDEENQELVVEDVKGMATPEAKLKRKIFIKKYCYDSDIVTSLNWVCKAPKWTGVDWIDYFELQKLRRGRKKVAK